MACSVWAGHCNCIAWEEASVTITYNRERHARKRLSEMLATPHEAGGEPEELAKAVVFLVGPDSSYAHGATRLPRRRPMQKLGKAS